MEKLLTTAEVPAQFLHDVFLLGHIPPKALAFDPRISYTLYVPDRHFSKKAAPIAEGGPQSGEEKNQLPLLVYVHGTRRDMSLVKRELVLFANSTGCAVAAPLFPAGLDGPNDINSYKLIRSATVRSDLAFLAMLDEIAHRWCGVIDTERVFLSGFSGGGQFAHRLLYLYPERLRAVSVGAPGRATFLNEKKDWPEGIANADTLFGRPVRKDLIAKVRIQLVIGADDVDLPGGDGFWAWLDTVKKARQLEERKEVRKDANVEELPAMKHGRLRTAQELRDMWRANGIDAQFESVQGVAHNAAEMLDSALRFLRPLIQQRSGLSQS